MKKIICIALSALALGCTSKSKGNFNLEGQISGLRKGTIYLERFENGKIVVIDSLYIDDGSEDFTFSKTITEPEIFILSLDKLNTKQLTFFGEPGTIHVETSLDNFITNRKVTGSTLNDILEKHDSYAKKINQQNLDLIKDKFEALKFGDTKSVDEIESKRLTNLKRLYLFSANYAIAYNDKAVAPFIACYRMEQATPALKQKIYDALTPEIKESKYGKILKESLN
ncbi:DUF4369 domain-containing protein [Wenyingzhuangia aestuarii]|uniref:DUF4369 domain-containing protein n=1 Tax=Wenyingzhuangia aestuarii TaxID=1647582 RepID=UPI0014398362|nr:DUF4369 domain-containing protein [Wenyingzhuangia aestuarii]NJB83228.1 hypothetical protein [Wenyingzhuangia aestuarii]